MVYHHLSFEDMNQLMKHQIMSSSHHLPCTTTTPIHPPPKYIPPSPPSSLSENNILMQCMQKLGQHYPAPTSRVVLQESNGQIISASSAQGEGADDQHAASAGCTPRPRWCPTPEQIQVLESLFNSGTTTPSRDMIVEIAACLKQFGNIVEANVFYWFQNRKARAKRKLRMQAQLQLQQQQQAASPTDSDHCLSAPIKLHNVKTAATSRRVCARTACKSSPNSFAAPDHHLPPLIHFTAAANHADHHSDQHSAASCGMIMDDHQADQLGAAAAQALIMPPQLYAAGDIKAQPSLQMINNANDLSLCYSSANPTLTNQAFDSLHQAAGVSQTRPSHVITHSAPAPPLTDHESTDHHFSCTQKHIECDQYNPMSRSFISADKDLVTRCCSRPGSADGTDVMIGRLQHPTSPTSSTVAQSDVIISSQLYHAAAPNFTALNPQNHNQLVPSTAAACQYSIPSADHYNTAAVADHYSSSGAYAHSSDQLGSLSLPNKRSWMEALMQEFVIAQNTTEPTDHNRSASTSTSASILQIYDSDHYAGAQTNELINNIHIDPISSVDLNLLLQQGPQSQLDSSQGVPFTSPNPCILSRSSMDPAMVKDLNKGIDTVISNKQQNILASSPFEAAYHELHEAAIISRRDQPAFSSENSNLMCSNTTTTATTTSQQQIGILAKSLPRFHHCDNLPLWEALAPYMSIGS